MDSDVERYLGYFTFLPMDEVKELAKLKPPLLNRAKEILAFEATAITHSEEDARNAYLTSIDKFGEADPKRNVQTSSAILELAEGAAESPQVLVEPEIIQNGFSVLEAFVKAGLVSSKGEARRLIQQGGAYIDEKRVSDESLMLTGKDFSDGGLTLRAGKKQHMKLVLSK